jgi:hypothetical protein
MTPLKIPLKIIFLVASFTLILFGCSNKIPSNPADIHLQMHKEPPKSVNLINIPDGYERVAIEKNSFGEYLRNFALKTDDDIVNLYNGTPKSNQNTHFTILDLDVGSKDLQQCADAVMRLRAEYLFEQKKYHDIHFNFTNGTKADYSKYAQGYRPQIDGNKVHWIKSTTANDSYEGFRNYLDIVFTYAGSASLSKELKPQNINDMQIGDVFIQGGFPGHAVIVMDMAKHKKTGKKIFLLAQSYMPAQEMHILKNLNNTDLNPWYDIDFEEELRTPEWTFKKEHLMRF